MRGILLVVFASIIIGAVAIFVFHRDELPEIGGSKETVGGLPKTIPLSEITAGADISTGTVPVDTGTVPRILTERLETADKYLEESLLLSDPKQRLVLIEKINGFKDSYESVINMSGSDPDILRATARYIAKWSPFYYYIHPDAQAVLGPVVKILEKEREEILKKLVKQDARLAGKLAAEDIEYYIEDIRKSAARRNSDFITFSLQDYERYRKIFDELAKDYPEFLFGFAANASIFFDDLYRMHEEVDMDYLDKTRKKVEDVRLGLRELHKQALLDLNNVNPEEALLALEKTIRAIGDERSSRNDWREEIHAIMEDDYNFYRNIEL